MLEEPAAPETSEAHAQLLRDHAELSAQFTATNEVLTAVGKSAGDPDAVLGTIVEAARRLCRADACQLYRFDGTYYRLSKSLGLDAELADYLAEHPLLADRNTLAGRVGLDRNIQQIADVLADPDYGRRDLPERAGFRTTMSAPLIVDDQVVGALSLWRNEVSPFDDRAVAIMGAFTGQAAIALRTVNLVQELGRKVDQLEALSEVGDAVSSSLDLDQVLSTIVSNAVELSETDGGSVMEYSEADRCFSVRFAYGTGQAMLDELKGLRIGLEGTLVGRASLEGRPLVVADLADAPLDPHLEVMYKHGWRSLVVVPMHREGRIVGGLVIRRKAAGDFSEETVELLQTFASQSSLAILNARLFRELEEQSAQLEIASRHKSEFLASMSHELRTPLNAVLGFSEVLLERMFGEINERQEEYLRDIWSSGRHLLELLNEILDLSKVEAGQMDLDYSTFDVRDALEYSASMLRERATSHGIDVYVEVTPEVDAIEADELRFKQVVLNLVTNAVKFTPDGGSVTIQARAQGDDVVFAVTDTGIGVPQEERERIFESFQQGGRGASREEGTGLGLTLSRRIVELLGGRMWLTSEVGVGSTFSFAIPARSTADTADEASAYGPGQVPSVVIIDDDRPSMELLSAYLSGIAVQVSKARDGQAGLAAVRRTNPSVVLLDIRLPGIDGWEVLRLLKSDPVTAAVPVVIVSIVDEETRGAELGAAAYLVKPVGRDDLLATLTEVGAFGSGAQPSPRMTREEAQ
jgi:signal transduction histidine kinase/ActR/RegA family two-component response regulator